MTNPERDPAELVLDPCAAADEVEVLTAREVPLGGPRAMTVRRTLPQRHRSLIGAWCFVDHYGPDRVADTGGMVGRAPPAHRAADRQLAVHRRGRAHRQRRPPRHGAARRGQPDDRRPRHQPLRGVDRRPPTSSTAPSCGSRCRTRRATSSPASPTTRPTPSPATAGRRGCSSARCSATASPVETHTPLLGAELLLDAGAALELDVDPAFEHGVLVDTGVWPSAGQEAKPGDLAYVAPGRRRSRLAAGAEPARRAAPRRDAVRRVHRDVVELRRPQPRGDRRLPRGVAAPGHATGDATAASASSTTRSRRSPPRRCPTRGCKERR